MKIGHYAPNIWAPGGVASYIRRVSQEQKQLGHEVVYFDLIPPGGIPESVSNSIIFVKDEAALFTRAAQESIEILHVHMGLSEMVQSQVPVIRTVHGHSPYCPSGSRFLEKQGKPCGRTYNTMGCAWNHFSNHCGSMRPALMLSGFRNTRNEMRMLRTIPAITVSQFLKDQMLRAGYREDLIHVLHLAVPEVKAIKPPPSEGIPHFVFLGRITPLKGVAWLLRAIKEVQTPIHLDIAGEGYGESEVHQLATHLGLNDRVTFHGWVSPEKVDILLAQSRALIFPSLWHEPAGFVSLEAMINGRAVIASSVGGIPEYVINEMNGLLVEPNDVFALARTIERLAKDWHLAKSLGEEGYRIATESFSLDNHVQKLMKIYSLYCVATSEQASPVG